MLKILITGSQGMLGAYLARYLSEFPFDIYTTGRTENHSDLKYFQFDFFAEDYSPLSVFCDPDFIIHCAAATDTKYCELHPLKCNQINGYSLLKLSKAFKSQTKIIYISSDSVFSNNLVIPNEKSQTQGYRAYGKSKELGEKFCLESPDQFLILRTTIVGFNTYKNPKVSLAEFITNTAKKGREINLYEDAIFNPISIYDLAKEIKFLIENNVDEKILHISGKESISKLEFGEQLLKSLNLDTCLINKVRLGNTDLIEQKLDQTIDCNYYFSKYERTQPNFKQLIKSLILNYENGNTDWK